MFYRLWWLTLGMFIRVYARLRITDRHKVPGGAVILASNHQSGVDPGAIGSAYLRRIWWLAKIDLVRSRKTAWFFRSVSVIPIDRDAPEQASIDAALSVLRRGKTFAIFPEGTRAPDERVYRGYTGVARIAKASGAPVVPVAVLGTRKVAERGQLIPRPMKVEVRFGDPLRFSQEPGEEDKAAFRRFTDDVMGAIAALAGVDQVDRYSREPRRRSGGAA